MAKLNKSFCKLDKKDVKEHLHEIMPLVAQPRFVCKKCARAAGSRKNLCGPQALPESLSEPAAAGYSQPLLEALDS
ncbi:MAG: hypothetical protein ACOC2C_03145 [Cyclonatronaceae bacterium]